MFAPKGLLCLQVAEENLWGVTDVFMVAFLRIIFRVGQTSDTHCPGIRAGPGGAAGPDR